MRYAPYLFFLCVVVTTGCQNADIEDETPPVSARYDARDELVGDVIGTDERLARDCESAWQCSAIAPRLTIIPGEIAFYPLQPFEQDVQRVTLKNEGDANLRIGALILNESDADTAREVEPADEETLAFFEVFERGGLIFMAPGATIDLSFVWKPVNEENDDTMLVIECNDPEQPSRQVMLSTPDSTPMLTSSLPQVEFPRVKTDSSAWQIFTLENTGNYTLRLVDAEVAGSASSEFTLSYPTSATSEDPTVDRPDPPRELDPGETMFVRVTFTPNTNRIREAELRVLSDSVSGEELVIPLRGNTGPCLEVMTPVDFDGTIAFGGAQIGREVFKTLALKNCAESALLTIDGITLEDAEGVFGVKSEDRSESLEELEWPVTLSPREVVRYQVTTLPEMEAIYEASLLIEHDDPSWQDAQIELSAKGVSDVWCPEALAEASVVGEDMMRPATEIVTTPLKTIQLQGRHSRHPDGLGLRYEWNIVSKPSDSGTRLTPNNSVEDPRLFLDVAGEYEIELTVYDTRGTRSCDTSKVTILAAYQEDIHIQLTWQTPGDPDQTDTFGTDLDLHYMRPGGSWDDAAFDVFWQNPEADWGEVGDPSDNPSLDFDDTDGLGPENIYHSNPQSGLTYLTGVYYKDDNGFGNSYATVRIYIDGQLEFEVLDKQLEESNTFWDVASITWPSKTVLLRDRLFSGFPR